MNSIVLNEMQIGRDDPRWQPADRPELFTGSVRTMDIFENDFMLVRAIEFAPGVTNRPHSHDYPQTLIALYGLGFVATNREYISLWQGDVHIEPNPTEPHLHGSAGDVFAHAVILGGERKIIPEPTATIIGPNGNMLIE